MEITHWCKITADLVISLALGQLNTLTWDILTISDNTHYGCQCDNIIKTKSDQNQSEPEARYVIISPIQPVVGWQVEVLSYLLYNDIIWSFSPSCPGPPHLILKPPGLQVRMCKGVKNTRVADPFRIQPLNSKCMRSDIQTKLLSSYPNFAHCLVQVRCWM